jgi:hypothetical protein
MTSTQATALPGNSEAKALILLFPAAMLWGILVFSLDRFPAAVIPTAYAVPFLLVVCLFFAVSLFRRGTSTVSLPFLLIGWLFIVGGVLLDVTATLIHTPDLANEGNVLARTLLDSGHDLTFVYVYGAIAQTLVVLFLSALWFAFLRHRTALVESIPRASSFPVFLKASTGGAQLSWRQWLCPLRSADLPWSYHLQWWLAILLIAGCVDRWYLALEWWQGISGFRWQVLGFGWTLATILYFRWLWRATRLEEPHELARD